MALAAQQVAEAVRSRIGPTAYTDHPHPFAEAELPAWRVVYEGELTEGATMDGTVVQHGLKLRAIGHARAVDDLDAALNAMAATALPLIFAPPVPYGLQPDGEIERPMPGEGEAAIGAIEIPLRAIFFTRADAPETILS